MLREKKFNLFFNINQKLQITFFKKTIVNILL